MTNIVAETIRKLSHEECERKKREETYTACQIYHAPDWAKWGASYDAELWEMVALSVDIDPECIREYAPENRYQKVSQPSDFRSRMHACCSHADRGDLKAFVTRNSSKKDDVTRCHIRFEPFASFALDQGWALPSGFPRHATKSGTGEQWPWGNFETALLGKLADAANKFWKNYDPADKTTAPTKKDVIAWLGQQGVAKRTAEIMATILRPDGLPPGPRR